MSKEEKDVVDESLKAQISSKVDTVIEEMKTAKDESDTPDEDDVSSGNKDKEPEDDAVSGEDESDNDTADTKGEKSSVSDELLTRAVKLGIDLSKAKNSDSAFLEHICDQMEAVNKEDEEKDKKAEEKSDDKEIEDALKEIPELNPDEYDDDLVKSFAGIKGIVGRLLKENKELRAFNTQGKQQSFFDSKISGLDENTSKVLKDAPEKREALSKKFSILEAGYKATGEKMDRDSIFAEAVAMTLGNSIDKAKEDSQKEKLSNREKQFIKRPGSSKNVVDEDPKTSVANEINKKYFGRG